MTDLATRLNAFRRTDNNGLLACPFCGGQASCQSLGEYHDDEQNAREDFVVGCDACHAVFPPFSDKTLAADAWNSRAEALIALVQEAAGEIERLKKLVAESRDALDAAIPCIGRDSSSFSTLSALRQVREQRERCQQALNPQQPEALSVDTSPA